MQDFAARLQRHLRCELFLFMLAPKPGISTTGSPQVPGPTKWKQKSDPRMDLPSEANPFVTYL